MKAADPCLGALIDAMRDIANRLLGSNCSQLCKSSTERDETDLASVIGRAQMRRAAIGEIALAQMIGVERAVLDRLDTCAAQTGRDISRQIELPVPFATGREEAGIGAIELLAEASSTS